MPKLIKNISKKTGLPPGTLVHIGKKKVDETKITIMDYDQANSQEKEAETVEECFRFKEEPTVTWINVDGLHDLEILQKLGDRYGLHPLVLEDVVNTGKRPKIDDLESYIFVVLKMLYRDEETDEVMSEQISLVLGSNFVISFQEKPGDVFAPIRERIRNNKGRVRKMGADYLAYALIDAIVDNYFIVLESIGEQIESMEADLVSDPKPETLQNIHELKSEVIYLRKSIWPLREVISCLERGESDLIKESTIIYLRDVYDHTIQVIDTIETFKDMLSGMLDIYLSSASNRMNEVMKVLTIIATIFIPLGFLAGLYGMNFENMPELHWRWGYFGLLSIMILAAGAMLFYFKRKNWI
jgi:magnesium transporter